MRFSGLQREVLALYRRSLREIRKKPTGAQENFRQYARAEFRKNLNIAKKDFPVIEHLLRNGHRQLNTYASPEVRDIVQ